MANEKNGSPIADSKKSGLVLRPVSAGESGEGLPYAPVDWPKRGDIWRWKVGKRITKSGFMADRNLYLPSSLKKSFSGIRLASLPAVKEFISKQFPDADLEAFLGSFSWKIPSKECREDKDRAASSSIQPMEEKAEHHVSESDTGFMACKVGNEMCSLNQVAMIDSIPSKDCDICSIEPHIDCALRSYMAGTVRGSINKLDVEYYCGRCNHQTDLMSHVTKLVKTCESVGTRDDIEKILNVGCCLLHGSQQESARKLQTRIELTLTKLRSGVRLEDIWREEDNVPVVSSVGK